MELILIRHAQASFGAADYDVLSDLGHRQSRALGAALADLGTAPASIFTGRQRRHRETLDGIAASVACPPAEEHAGLNEFDFGGLLEARFRDRARPLGLHDDRRTHFRILKETVLAWQADEIADPPETWAAFTARVAAARDAMLAARGPVLAVSSGGALSRMIAMTLEAPAHQSILLQLQVKNCAVSRLIAGRNGVYLAGFNETPHITGATRDLLTYS